MEKKHVLLMGFGTQAVRYIESIKQKGCTLSAGELSAFFEYPPNEEYVKQIDNKIEYNDFETESFLELIRKVNEEQRLNAIVPLTDAHVVATALASQQLGLRSAGIKAAVLSTNKGLQRSIFKMAGIQVPDYQEIVGENFSKEQLESITFPRVLKPDNKFGSIGVRIVYNKEEAYVHLEELKKISNVIMMEEYIDGPEFSVESVVKDGVIKFVNITKKFVGELPLFVEESHMVPYPDLAEKEKASIEKLNGQVIQVMEVEDSLVHLEARLTKNGPVVIEVAVRMPGDRIMDLIEYSTGVNLYDAAVDIALGNEPKTERTKENYSRVYWFSSKKAGNIKKINGLDKIENLPETKMLGLLKGEGDYINLMKSSFDRVGFCIGCSKEKDALELYIGEVCHLFSVEIE